MTKGSFQALVVLNICFFASAAFAEGRADFARCQKSPQRAACECAMAEGGGGSWLPAGGWRTPGTPAYRECIGRRAGGQAR